MNFAPKIEDIHNKNLSERKSPNALPFSGLIEHNYHNQWYLDEDTMLASVSRYSNSVDFARVHRTKYE